jgi:glycerol-3-phosphate dehydrogenase subunit B
VEQITDRIAAVAREQAADHVIVPAVLGLNEHARTYKSLAVHLSAACGATLGEALGTAPSLPGWRLDRALLAALDEAGVHVIAGRVIRHDARAGRVHGVSVTRDDETFTITPRIIVLAAGKFTGGGIAATSRFTDAVFGTDVEISRFGRTFRNADAALALTDPVRTEPQPVLGLGVATDVDSRLMSAAGDVVFDNVLVAGSIRAGVETASLGLGAAATDGWTIGARAAETAPGERAWA